MRAARRLLQVVALVGTLLVGVVAVALIVSQTPWFKDWLRRYIVRESKQYLNGELSIGQLGGNLFFGVQLGDVAVDLSGERVVAVRGLEVEYSVFTLVSEGIVIDRIELAQPRVHLERTADGWNVGRLVKKQEREADREGPRRPIELRSIRIAGGAVTVADDGENGGVTLPARMSDLDLRASFAYQPVRYTVEVEHLGFNGQAPDLTLQRFTGTIAVRDDNLYLDKVVVNTGGSSLRVDGVLEQYLKTPIVRLTTTGKVSLPEIGRIVPAASGYPLHPELDVQADGPLDALGLDLGVKSEAGNVSGTVTADVQAPRFGVKGEVSVDSLNLAPLLRNPEQKSDITGTAQVDITLESTAEQEPVLDRMSGTFRFEGPRLAAAGYRASDVRATGQFRSGRVELNARANAYGGRATASGFVAPPSGRRPLAFDLQGEAHDVNLQGLPAATGAPALETDLSVAQYRIQGRGRAIRGSARLNESVVEGATVAAGTTGAFETANGKVSYAAKGSIEDLDLQRLGGALRLDALQRPEFDGLITGTFDVTGAGTSLETMTLEASGTLAEATIMGARVSDLAYDTRIADGGLEATVNGAFEGLDPGVAARQERLAGRVNGTVDAQVAIADLSAPITPDAIEARGQISLRDSEVGGLRIEAADVQGTYVNRVGDIQTINVKGPDLNVTANGRLSLDRTTTSDLTYHLEATDLATLGPLAGQEGLAGSIVLDGRLTGNAASMRSTGTLNGSNLSYQENNALDLNATYDVTVPELTFADARVQATTTAHFVKAGGLELNSVEATTTYVQKTLEFAATLQQESREVEASGDVIFHPDHQEIHLPELAIRTAGQEWRSAPDVAAAVQYGGGTLSVENVRLVSGEQRLDADGTLALEGADGAGALKVRASNIDLAALEQLLLMERGLSGQLNATATITGTAQRPAVEGHVEIAGGGFRNYRYESLTADVEYGEGRIELDARLQQSPTEAFTATGVVPMSLFARSEQGGHVAASEEDRLDLRIQSTDLSLGFIQGFTTAITNVTGTLQADVRLTGSGEDPHAEGHIDIRNGAFGVPLAGVSYTGLDTRIALTRDLVTIRAFELLDEEGAPLRVSGQLAVHEREVGAVDVSLGSKNFEVIDNELGDVGVDTTLRITGELRRPVVTGNVRVARGRLEVDRILAMVQDPFAVGEAAEPTPAERLVAGAGSAEQATAQALGRAGEGVAPVQAEPQPPAAEEAEGGFTPVALDVKLLIPDNLVLRGSDLRPGGRSGVAIGDMNITVGGDLQIRKKPDGPVTVTGVVNTVRGTYEFQGRRFDLVRGGTLRFTGETEINPLLDVTATRVIPSVGVEARIHVTGTVQEPELELTSNPPLDEADILALIVFNRPVNELGSGERASLATTAGGIATGFLAAPLGESIGRALDVDIFEITTTTEAGDLGAGFTIGQQVGERVFFKLRQQFGEQSVTEFLLEYQIAQFLRVRGSAAPETTGSANRLGQRRVERAGIDLIFFFSY